MTTTGHQAMILAAGLGTRLKPWTDHHPKALAPVNGRSLLQHNIQYLQQFGIFEVIVNVHHFAGQITAAIESNKGWGSRVVISDETDAVLETGGGLKKAIPFFSKEQPFVLMNADILTRLDLDDMMTEHLRRQPLATLAVTERETSRYFLFNTEQVLCGWENRKTGEQKIRREEAPLAAKAFSGIHIIDPAIFPLIEEEGKFSMVDLYLRLCPQHFILGYDHSGILLMDVGKPESLAEAEKHFP